jgi:hypothetical protein
MQELQFSITINATKEQVWATLWDDQTFRDWANVIDEGMYMIGDMKEGGEVQFLSSVNGYGVTSLVEQLIPFEMVLFRHFADTIENGHQIREDEWSGGTEQYSLAEENGMTYLTVKTEVPLEMVELFQSRFPIALERIKTITNP